MCDGGVLKGQEHRKHGLGIEILRKKLAFSGSSVILKMSIP